MVDKHFELELAVTHLRSFVDNVATMESSLKRCEERVRTLEEKKKKFESLWEFEEWTGEGSESDTLDEEDKDEEKEEEGTMKYESD
ncbi:hypothetical protein QBC32DRAFT_310787 [Pseudoneurospora amorphoporcata]|uniref:Uncharacterized protein n=1 Tax=Pseudoneurospora amorphoporcata TaxID=241081 RepID=A0AAN6SJJ8_9PEZI|nr:hypothetical protein QBC32DRAFT_310787 [Pseudoneurospora amorphoporcata]